MVAVSNGELGDSNRSGSSAAIVICYGHSIGTGGETRCTGMALPAFQPRIAYMGQYHHRRLQ